MRFIRVAAIAGTLALLLAAPVSAGIVADLSVVKVDTPDPVAPGANITYTITVENQGTSTATIVELNDTIPTGTTFVMFTAPAGWTCSTPPVGGTGTVTCTIASLPVSTVAFTLVVNVNASAVGGSTIFNNVTIECEEFDPAADNSSGVTTTVVVAAASVPDAAMPEPLPSNPLTILGFAALFVGLMTGTAVLAVRRSRI